MPNKVMVACKGLARESRDIGIPRVTKSEDFKIMIQGLGSNEIEQSYWMRTINWTHGL